MGDKHDKESLGVVCAVSWQAGAVAGTSVAISRKIAGCGARTIIAARDCLTRPLKCLVPTGDEKSGDTPPESAVKSTNMRETERKKAAKALIATLESDLAAVKLELKKAQSNAEITQAKLASQLDELKVEKESLISDLEQAKSRTGETAAREDQVKTRVTALESDLAAARTQLENLYEKNEQEQYITPQTPFDLKTADIEEDKLPGQVEEKIEVVSPEKEAESEIQSTPTQSVAQPNAETEEKPSHKAVAVAEEMPAPDMVTDEQVKAAVFSKATDKIIFSRALFDITGPDPAVRADAARTIAGIRHELSIKALDARIAYDTSVPVRQECVKALATLEMRQGLPAVERALKDTQGPVRLAAVWGLYRLAGSESAPTLIRMFDDEDEEVRRRAATCLGWLRQEELAAELLPLLNDNSPSVRRAAAEAMGNLRNRQVVSALIERLNDPVESVRKTILGAIETITGKKMSKSLPKSKKEFERLITRWQQWRKDQLLG